MSRTLLPHPDQATLLRLLDDDLSSADRQVVDGHAKTNWRNFARRPTIICGFTKPY